MFPEAGPYKLQPRGRRLSTVHAADFRESVIAIGLIQVSILFDTGLTIKLLPALAFIVS